ncbi:MAG: PKD domain-containing protein [Methanospirillum sp.]
MPSTAVTGNASSAGDLVSNASGARVAAGLPADGAPSTGPTVAASASATEFVATGTPMAPDPGTTVAIVSTTAAGEADGGTTSTTAVTTSSGDATDSAATTTTAGIGTTATEAGASTTTTTVVTTTTPMATHTLVPAPSMGVFATHVLPTPVPSIGVIATMRLWTPTPTPRYVPATAPSPVTPRPTVTVCSLDFTGSPTSGRVPLAVTFMLSSSCTGGYTLDFGDGQDQPVSLSPSAPETVRHTYTEPGEYTVVLADGSFPHSTAYKVRSHYITVEERM